MARRPANLRSPGTFAGVLYAAVLIATAGLALVGHLRLKSEGTRAEAQIARLQDQVRRQQEANRKLAAQLESLTSHTAIKLRLGELKGIGEVPPDLKVSLPEPPEPPVPAHTATPRQAPPGRAVLATAP